MLTLPVDSKPEDIIVPPSGLNAIRFNCKAGAFAVDKNNMVTVEPLDIVVCGFTTGVGLIPPLTTVDSVDKRLALMLNKSLSDVIKMDPLDKATEVFDRDLQRWAYLWYVLLDTPSNKKALADNASKMPVNVLTGSALKSVGLDKRVDGFLGQGGYLDNLAMNQLAPAQVITTVGFDELEKADGSTYFAVQFNYRKPDTKDEKAAHGKVFNWLKKQAETGLTEFTKPRELTVQFMECDITDEAVVEDARNILMEVVNHQGFEGKVDLPALRSGKEAPALMPVPQPVDLSEDTAVETVPA